MSGINIAVLISGGGSNLQALIDHTKSGEINGQVCLVVSNKREAYGLNRAAAAHIETAVIDRQRYPDQQERDDALLGLFTKKAVDLVVLAGYLEILSSKVIEAYANQIMNIHPSLLPSFSGKGYYGIKVHRAAINRGVKLSGATVHFVNEETDGGPIILQRTVVVDPKDSPETLQKKVLAIEHEILPRAVKLFAQDRLIIDKNKVHIRAER